MNTTQVLPNQNNGKRFNNINTLPLHLQKTLIIKVAILNNYEKDEHGIPK